MNEKKLSAQIICHIVLMGLLFAVSIASAIIIFTGNIPEGFDTKAYLTTTSLYGAAHILNAVCLMCGIIYLAKGGGKNVRVLYKTFILLMAVGVVLRFIGTLIHPGFNASVCLMIVIIVALLILCFGKDLGKKNTMIIFYILIAAELAVGILTFDKNEVFSSIVGNLSRLVLAGSIGIAIFAKYDDKAARGREV